MKILATLIPRKWRAPLGRAVMAVLPPPNFLTLHYAYFIATCIVTGIVFYLTSTPWRSVAYVDAFFLCVSAMTEAGLNTVDLSTLNGFQQAILFVLLLLGSPILVSSTVLLVRKRAFESKLKSVSDERERKWASRRASALELELADPDSPRDDADSPAGCTGCQVYKCRAVPAVLGQSVAAESSVDNDHIQRVDNDQITIGDVRSRHLHNHHHYHHLFPMAGVGAWPESKNHPNNVAPNIAVPVEDSMFGFKGMLRGTQKYFASRGFVSRNSQFHGLTSAEREALGGVEYKAVSFLSVLVPLYYAMFVLFGAIGVGWWLAANHPDVARENGLPPFWTGAFFAVSAFVNSGMALLDANMTALQLNAYPLMTMGMLILAGNTLYPCFLRFIIWILRKLMPDRPAWQSWRVTLDFILDHPRRVYTNLFPARHTWYLLGTIFILNGIDWAAFELLSIANRNIEVLPTEYRVLDGLFQALAVRSGGFYVVTIAELRQGLLVLYVVMMYVSAFPVLITMRNTNVYEERSLGIYAHDESSDTLTQPQRRSNVVMDLVRAHFGRPAFSESSRGYFVHQQLRSQLSHDIWWIAMAVVFIAIAEADHYEAQPVAFSTFNIIFEVVSAYGCVGLSVGFPGRNYSFCGAWHTISKLILAAVALRGRHRGLPVAIDKAVMLPSETLAWAEEEDAALRGERSRAWALDRAPVESSLV